MEQTQNKPDFSQIVKNNPSGYILRTRLYEETGGLLHGRTMANLDSLGEGIPGKISIGRKVCYEDKTVEQYSPCQKVVEFCKTKIGSIMSGDFDNEWFYNIKDFYMKEERIKLMSTEEIESLKSMGNKEQVKHFIDLVKQSKQA